MVKKIRHSTFRKNITRSIFLMLAAIFTCTLLGLTVLQVWQAHRSLTQDINVLADIIGNRSLAALEFGSRENAEKNLASAQYQKHVDLICLYDASGDLFSDYRRSGAQSMCGKTIDSPLVALEDFAIVVRKELRLYDTLAGYITVTTNNGYIFEGARLFLVPMVALIIGILWLGLYVTQRILRAVASPLEDLHETAQALVDDAFSSRRVARHSDDEIGELVEVFNRMLDNLASENSALQSSENRFRTLTAHAPIGIFQLDRDGNLIYANDRWHKITETVGDAGAWHTHEGRIAKDDLDLYHSSWDRAVQNNSPVLVEYRYQSSYFGKPKYLMENIALLRGGNGVEGIIGTLADVTELKNAQKELEKLAFYDPLTQLPNRRFFLDLLGFGIAKAKRSGGRAAVLMLDMDNFKKINDLLGHSGGDELLQRQAKRIRAAVREQDAVSRMGGDEFTIMLSPVMEISEVTGLTKRVLDAINAPLMIGNHTVEIGASIGVALYPNDGEVVDDLIRNADMALYEAKGNGRNRVNFFSYKLDLEIREAVRLEQKLKQAIRNEALEVFLQPQISAGGQVVWAEALMRWFDAEEGAISPAKFIPLAEETGLIQTLGQWMLEQICFHMSQHREYLRLAGIKGISINLSARQFYSRSLLRDIRRVIEDHQVPPEYLEFELTESVVMDDKQLAIDVMRGLRDLGCRIAIDDFGTGHSSLAYLKRFPINSLKIDRSFVEDIPHDTHGSEIATAIIAMAHKLHLQVVAEGVETEAQRDFLVAQGCELMQGFLFSKPLHIQEFVNAGRSKFFEQQTEANGEKSIIQLVRGDEPHRKK